ncbi:MAG: hypothetical protein ACR2LL_07455 [Nitrosopumilus sp.]
MVVDKKAVVTYIRVLKEDLAIFRLVPTTEPVPDYHAGQFLTVGLPVPSENNKIIRRGYSIASTLKTKSILNWW